MQRKLNVRFLLWVFATLVIAGVGVHFVHAFQVHRNAAALLRQADRLVSEGNDSKACFYYSRYLVFEPNDTKALVRYALTLDKLATYEQAQTRATLVLDQAFRRGGGDSEVGVRLVHQQMALGRYGEAISNLQKLRGSSLSKGQVEHLLGWAHEARGAYAASGELARRDFQEAVAWFEKAVDAVPSQIESYLFLVHVHGNRLHNTDEAGRILDRLIETNKDLHGAYLIRARFHKQAHRLEAADKDLNRALELAPKDAGGLLLAAEWDVEKKNFTSARRRLEQGLELYPQAPAWYIALAKLELKTGNTKEAIEVLRRGLSKAPGSTSLIGLLTDNLLNEDAVQDAKLQITELRKHEAGSPVADYLDARVLSGQKKWFEAAELCEKALSRLSPSSEWTPPAYLLLGKCYEHRGYTEHELLNYQRAVAADPSSTQARLGIASAYLKLGRLDEAAAELGALQKFQTPPAEVWLLLARVHLLRNVQTAEPDRVWDHVHASLRRAVSAKASEAEVAILQAEVLAAQKKFSEADEVLQKKIAKDRSRMLLWCARSDLALRQNKLDQAKKILEEAQTGPGDSVELRLAWSRWALHLDSAERRRALSPLMDVAAFAEDEQIRLLGHFAALCQQLGDTGTAGKLWKQLADKQPRDVGSRFQLFELVQQRGQDAEARRLLADIKNIEGEAGLIWRYADAVLAFADARKGDKWALGKSRERIDEVRARHKTWSRLPLLEARIDEWEGKRQSALEKYRQAFQLGERTPRTTHRLVSLLYAADRFTEADEILRGVEQQARLDPALARLSVYVAQANQNAARALQLAERVVNPSSKDYRDLLWLGELLTAAGDKTQGEQVLRRAVELGGHTTETWVALVDCLARNEKWTEAEAVVLQAEKELPSDRQSVALARCYEVLSRHDRAEAFYIQALKENPRDSDLLAEVAEFFRRTDQPAKAEPHLRYLAELVSKEEATPVRRRLAAVLAETGRLTGALSVVPATPKGTEVDVNDRRLRAMIQGFQPGKAKQALQEFDQTGSQQALSWEQELWLARLCTAAGDHWRSGQVLSRLLNRLPDNPQVLAACVRSYLAAGQANEAGTHLEKLQKREPHSQRTQELTAALKKA